MTHITPRRLRVVLATALLACTLPLGLAACSTSSTSSDGADTAADATSGIGAQWGSCMRDAGFDVEDPDDQTVASGITKPLPGVDEQAFSTASATCAEQAGVEPASSADHQKWERQYDQVASCIRDNGYEDFPEQQPGSISTNGYPRAEEPEFDQTFRDCLAEFAPDTQTQDAG